MIDRQPVTAGGEDGGVRPVVYSASSLNSYLSCHLAWYFTYVLGEEGIQSEPQRVGIQVHDYVERRLRTLGRDLPTRDTSNRPEVQALLRVFDRDILPTYRNPILIEAEFQLEINGIPFSGILDAVDEHDVPPTMYGDFNTYWAAEVAGVVPEHAYILRDTKTTGSRPSKGKYRLAMTGYWLGATDLGYPPDAAQLDYIVRTQKPYYWPEVLEPIGEADIYEFAAVLETVANGVERGDYQPTGLGTWHCKSCSHRDICGPYIRYKEITDGE